MGKPLPLSERPYDAVLAFFFIVHLPVIVLLDAQTLFPDEWFPVGAQKLLQWHMSTNGDYLVRQVPPFFRALVVCEIMVQLPLHVALSYAFLKGKQWGRQTGIIYGIHTATTMVPILGDILASREPTRNILLAIYLPYLLIPLIVVARLLPYSHPFLAAPNSVLESKKFQ